MTQEQDRPMTTEDLARAGERESARESEASPRDDSAGRQEDRGPEPNQEAGANEVPGGNQSEPDRDRIGSGDQRRLGEQTPTAESARLGVEEDRTGQGQGAPAEDQGASREPQGLAASEPQTDSSAGSVHQGGPDVAEAETSLIAAQEVNQYRSRWNDIQGGFVDEPRETLAKADQLVAEVIQQLTRTFADERGRFEEQWTRGADVSTEDLRLAFRRYRSFFNGLLR
jgi:hypothetical protein